MFEWPNERGAKPADGGESVMELAFWNNPTALIIVMVLVLLLFGGSKIPEMMRGLGSGMREFKKGMNDQDDELDRDKREKEEQEKRIRARVEEEMRREDEARRQKGVS
jgi:sec-independent protein translocase protein TatA